MENINIENNELEQQLLKAKKWDNLAKIIESYYFDEDGNEIQDDENEMSLIEIGEQAVRAFGWPI